MILTGTGYEHRAYDAAVEVDPRVWALVVPEDVRKSVRGLIAQAIVAQTGLDRESVDGLIREGVVKIERDGSTFRARGELTVRLDTPDAD